MLLTPEHMQQLRPVFLKNLGACDHGMVREAKRDHQGWVTIAWHSMMNRERPLLIAGDLAARNAASIAVTHQNFFSITGVVSFILSPQGVAGCAQS